MKKMKKDSLKIWQVLPPVLYGVLALFVLGTTLGCLITHFFRDSLYAPLLSLYQNIINQLNTVDADRYTIFLLSLRRQLKFFGLLWFFSLTNVWRYYLWGFSLYTGFSKGLLLAFCVLLNGPVGVWNFVCFQFPQCLLLLPAYGLTICHCHRLNRQLTGYCSFTLTESSGQTAEKTYSRMSHLSKKQLIFHQLPCFLLDGALLTLGSLLEGYFNLPLLHLLLK